MRTLVVSNRSSGTAAPEVLEEHLIAPLGEDGYAIEIQGTSDGCSTVLRAIETFQPKRVVACGGDGTVACVASVLDRLDEEIELAVVPMGTANVFALELGLEDIEEACHLAREGEVRYHDMLRTSDGVALCRILMGNLSEPGRSSSARVKQRWKLLAYLLHGLPILLRPRGARFVLEIDGKVVRARASSVVVCNAGQTGWANGLWAPEIRADDGVADVVLVHSASFGDHVRLFLSRWLGRQHASPLVTHLQAERHIRVHLPKGVHGSRDGERLHGRVIDIEVVPRAIPVVTAPANAPAHT